MPIGVNTTVSIDKDASGAIRRANRSRMEDAMDKGFAVSQEEAPEDRGTLRQSGYQPTWDGDTIRFGYRANHAWPTEEGTAPFWPPIEPLLGWADRVLGDEGAAYAIQQKIAKYGISPQPFAEPGKDAAKRYLDTHSFREYLEREL